MPQGDVAPIIDALYRFTDPHLFAREPDADLDERVRALCRLLAHGARAARPRPDESRRSAG